MSGTVLVVDSSCDLPRSFLESHQIHILPVHIKTDAGSFADLRELKPTLDFYNQIKPGSHVNTSAASIQQISDLIREQLIIKYDAVQVVTEHADRSDVYKNIRETSYIHKENFQNWRRAANLDPKFRLRIIDSGSITTGTGLLVYEAVRLMKEKALSIDKLKKPLEIYKQRINTFVVTNHVDYLRHGDGKGSSDKSWLGYRLGKILGQKPVIRCYRNQFETVAREKKFEAGLAKILKQVQQEIESGQVQPLINTSYGGNLATIRANPDFNQFVTFCKKNRIKVMLSMMSAATSSKLGPGAFSISYANAKA